MSTYNNTEQINFLKFKTLNSDCKFNKSEHCANLIKKQTEWNLSLHEAMFNLLS